MVVIFVLHVHLIVEMLGSTCNGVLYGCEGTAIFFACVLVLYTKSVRQVTLIEVLREELSHREIFS